MGALFPSQTFSLERFIFLRRTRAPCDGRRHRSRCAISPDVKDNVKNFYLFSEFVFYIDRPSWDTRHGPVDGTFSIMALNYRVGQMKVQKQSTKKERLRLQFANERVSKKKHLFPLGCNLSKNKRDHLFPLGCNLCKNERDHLTAKERAAARFSPWQSLCGKVLRGGV